MALALVVVPCNEVAPFVAALMVVAHTEDCFVVGAGDGGVLVWGQGSGEALDAYGVWILKVVVVVDDKLGPDDPMSIMVFVAEKNYSDSLYHHAYSYMTVPLVGA